MKDKEGKLDSLISMAADRLSSVDVSKVQEKRKKISNTRTPKPHIEKKADGYDYVDEAYMRDRLNKYYPIWSWKIDDTEFLGAEWCIVRGTLTIIDNGIPRYFSSVGAARVQFKRNTEHLAENVVDIDKNVASANTNAFKRSINRLCNIADDVYRKVVKDVSLSKSQIDGINAMLDGLDDKIVKDISKGIDDMTINTENINPVIDKIKRLKEEREGKNGNSK